jgi:hypothetical protein
VCVSTVSNEPRNMVAWAQETELLLNRNLWVGILMTASVPAQG